MLHTSINVCEFQVKNMMLCSLKPILYGFRYEGNYVLRIMFVLYYLTSNNVYSIHTHFQLGPYIKITQYKKKYVVYYSFQSSAANVEMSNGKLQAVHFIINMAAIVV